MRHRVFAAVAALVPASLAAQSPGGAKPVNVVALQFEEMADIYGGRLAAALDSIPAARYAYRPTAPQQSIGYIAQHLESSTYGLCERIGGARHARTAKDSLADTIKAGWPKDTLVARVEAALRFCDGAIEGLGPLESPAVARVLIGLETDLAEHYSQLSAYMRLLGLVPPSALPRVPRAAVDLPASALAPYVGEYELARGWGIVVTMHDGGLFASSTLGGGEARLWPASATEFFARDVDAQVTFIRDPARTVSGLVVHQNYRNRPARKIK